MFSSVGPTSLVLGNGCIFILSHYDWLLIEIGASGRRFTCWGGWNKQYFLLLSAHANVRSYAITSYLIETKKMHDHIHLENDGKISPNVISHFLFQFILTYLFFLRSTVWRYFRCAEPSGPCGLPGTPMGPVSGLSSRWPLGCHLSYEEDEVAAHDAYLPGQGEEGGGRKWAHLLLLWFWVKLAIWYESDVK